MGEGVGVAYMITSIYMIGPLALKPCVIMSPITIQDGLITTRNQSYLQPGSPRRGGVRKTLETKAYVCLSESDEVFFYRP